MISGFENKDYRNGFDTGYEYGLADGETKACSEGALRSAYEQGKEEGKVNTYDDMASAVGLFIAQCGEMAEENWCPSQVEMLERLFGAVLQGCEYADYELKEQKNE